MARANVRIATAKAWSAASAARLSTTSRNRWAPSPMPTRFMTRNGWIENHARCETCGEEYSFFLDKYDKPIKERARIAAVLF